MFPIADIAVIQKGASITKEKTIKGDIPVVAGGKDIAYYHNQANREANIITISASGAYAGFINYFQCPIFASDCCTIKSKDENAIPTKLIFFFLQSIQSLVYGLQKGQAQPHVYGDDIAKIKIPVPPIDIQKKIVEEIELIENKCKNLKDYISVCKDSITGIVEACFSKYKSESIGNLSTSVEYGTSSKSEKKGVIPVIRMGNIQDGEIDWSDLVYTSNETEIAKYSLKEGDILFNRTNSPELVGKVGIYRGERPAIFAGYLIRINYKKDLILPTYLLHILNSKSIREYGFSVMSKSVNQANINGTLLKAYRIPVPSMDEQKRIVAQIEALELEIRNARDIIENAVNEKQAILDKYL